MPLKLHIFREVNVNDRSSETELQITVCVFRSTYAFHLIAEGLTVCPLSRGLIK